MLASILEECEVCGIIDCKRNLECMCLILLLLAFLAGNKVYQFSE